MELGYILFILFQMLQLLNFDNPETLYHQRIDGAEQFIERDIIEFTRAQPPTVFPVSGLNIAPSGPAPSRSGVSSSGTRSRRTAKNEEGPPRISGVEESARMPGGHTRTSTKRTPEGDARISGVEESARMPGGRAKAALRPSQASSSSGPTGASLKPLVRETKNKLPLPYYDTENDPYIFKQGKINNSLN